MKRLYAPHHRNATVLIGGTIVRFDDACQSEPVEPDVAEMALGAPGFSLSFDDPADVQEPTTDTDLAEGTTLLVSLTSVETIEVGIAQLQAALQTLLPAKEAVLPTPKAAAPAPPPAPARVRPPRPSRSMTPPPVPSSETPAPPVTSEASDTVPAVSEASVLTASDSDTTTGPDA